MASPLEISSLQAAERPLDPQRLAAPLPSPLELLEQHATTLASLSSLELSLAQHSADEIVAALGLRNCPEWIQRGVAGAFIRVSLPLGRTLARFDARIATHGISQAAAQALQELGATWESSGAVPSRGALLVATNHPGAYDALVLLAAMGRHDVAVLAAERSFLRALPNLSRHLLWVPDQSSNTRRASVVRRAHRHLLEGGAVLHFGAGQIEPDPAFVQNRASLLRPWCNGTGALVRGLAAAQGVVVSALVMGVHSRRVKRLLINRVAERFGISTLAPLLQITIPRYREVRAKVHFAEPYLASELMRRHSSDQKLTAWVRARAEGLWGSRRG
ncbi:MAG: 1-acyl-sn-glycerol-3-phosphate acyltransferase [Myxococcales bacterium]